MNFKAAVIDSLQGVYSPDQILYVSAANLSLVNVVAGTTNLLESGIGFLLIKHAPFVFSFDLVRSNEVIMRIVLTPQLRFDVEDHKVTWVELADEYRCWQVQTAEPTENLKELCRIAQFEVAKKQPIT